MERLEALGYPVVDVPEGACASEEAAVAYLVDALVRTGRVHPENAPGVVQRLLQREAVGSTGIGEGLALPHLSTAAVSDVTGVIGRASVEIPWPGAFDGGPVRALCLLLTPLARPTDALLSQQAVIRYLLRRRATDHVIRQRAYRHWEAAGRPACDDWRFWFQAERDLIGRR